MRRFDVGIAGFGQVGRSVAALLLERLPRYRELYDADVRLTAVCTSSAGEFDPQGLTPVGLQARLTTGLTGVDFLAAAPLDVVIEAGPSNHRTGGPGYAYIADALARGRHVIVISKGALVFDAQGLQELARQRQVALKISGATAAALPTIDLMKYNLMGCEINAVAGILNATTNHILSEMMARGLGFDAALREAQEAGIAEPDPAYDVEGWDTACKLLILANFGLGANLSMADVSVGGIQHVTLEQVKSWRENDKVPKLIGTLTRTEQGFAAEVGLRTLATTDIFTHVAGMDKAIRVTTDVMGEITAIGRGAGPRATAAAALKDLEHILVERVGQKRLAH